ncbi:hypothetical protein [Actinoplanes subglobosus]|uniref:Uncharacterized protein n=1 Tax=Actinoplanes subglobosus TaxID=1547892 RepID=A0ABV8IVI0_9ACTN
MIKFLVALAVGLPIAVVTPAAQASPPPDGRISLAALRDATLDVPRWPADGLLCPSGRVRFRDGEAAVTPSDVPDGRPPAGQSLTILAAAHGDIDNDGADETVALLGCMIEGGTKQIVAYDRDRDGRIVSRGRVTATTGQVRDIRDDSLRIRRSGMVTARLADYQRCCADTTPQTWQTRGYALRAGRFIQVSGPSRMPLNPSVTAIRVTTGDLTLGPPNGGYRYGSVEVTVTHRWGSRPKSVVLQFLPPDGLERTGDRWPPVTTAADSFEVRVAAPAAGRSVTHRFEFRRPAGSPAGGDLAVDLSTKPPTSPAVPWETYATAKIVQTG